MDFNFLTFLMVAMLLLIIWALLMSKLGFNSKDEGDVKLYIFFWILSVVMFCWVMTWQHWWR